MPRWLASMVKFSSKLDYKMIEFFTRLDYGNVKLQNRDISLISLRKRVKCWKVCEKGTNAHFDPNFAKKQKEWDYSLRLTDLRKEERTFSNLTNGKLILKELILQYNFHWWVPTYFNWIFFNIAVWKYHGILSSHMWSVRPQATLSFI